MIQGSHNLLALLYVWKHINNSGEKFAPSANSLLTFVVCNGILDMVQMNI